MAHQLIMVGDRGEEMTSKEMGASVARKKLNGHFHCVRALSLYQAQGGCRNTWIDLSGSLSKG